MAKARAILKRRGGWIGGGFAGGAWTGVAGPAIQVTATVFVVVWMVGSHGVSYEEVRRRRPLAKSILVALVRDDDHGLHDK
jgi:hypothetical protein